MRSTIAVTDIAIAGGMPNICLKHHKPRDQLSGDVENEHERYQCDDDTNSFGLVAVAEELRNRPVAEPIAGCRHQSHADQDAEVDAHGVEEIAPLRRQTYRVRETGSTEKRCAAGCRGGESEGEKNWSVRSACGGEVIRSLDTPLTHESDHEHPDDVANQKNPGPNDE